MSKPSLTIRQYLAGAALALLVTLVLLGLMLYQAKEPGGSGLIGNLWYILLLAMGLAVAVFLFLGFKSYGTYTGQIFGGTVTLGGPAVLMLIVVGLGFQFAPPPSRFDLTVFVHGEAGPQAIVLRNHGALLLDLGTDRRRETIGDKGEVRFVGIPTDQRGRTAPVMLEAEGYELSDPKAQVKLSTDTAYLAVRPASVALSGWVQDEKGRGVPSAHLRLSSYTARTTEDGWFSIKVPSDIPVIERTLYVTAPGFEPSHLQATPGANEITIELNRSRSSQP
jgi:hypothetical protein